MSAAAALRCVRALPAANSTLSLLRKSSRSAPVNVALVAEREGANATRGCVMALQPARGSLDLARIVPFSDVQALNIGVLGVYPNVLSARPGLRGRINADAAACLGGVVTSEMEAVNRNARRPKKVKGRRFVIGDMRCTDRSQ